MIERIDMKCNLSHENGVEIKKCECGVEALMRRCPFEETTYHYMGRDENKALRQILSHQLYRYTFQAVDCLQAREFLVYGKNPRANCAGQAGGGLSFHFQVTGWSSARDLKRDYRTFNNV